MSTYLTKFKQFFKPKEKLPQGVTAFNEWADSIIAEYELPDNDSVRFMLATMILHAKEDAAYLPKDYFGLRAVKSAANQVAAGIMQDLKEKQIAKIEEEAKQAAKAKEEANATVLIESTSDAQQ